jgi:hypothetical protein
MSRGRTHAGVKTDGLEIGGHVLGGGAALVLERRVGGNRSDTQQSEQSLDAPVDILINAAQDRVESRHAGSLRAGSPR